MQQKRKENEMKKAATAKAQGKQSTVKNVKSMKTQRPVTVKGNKHGSLQLKGVRVPKCVGAGPSDPHKEPKIKNEKIFF